MQIRSIFLILILLIHFNSYGSKMEFECTNTQDNAKHTITWFKNYKIVNTLNSGSAFDYIITEENVSIIEGYFDMKKEKITKRFRLKLDLTTLNMRDDMLISKGNEEFKLVDRKLFSCISIN